MISNDVVFDKSKLNSKDVCLSYKGYEGKVRYDREGECFCGRITNIWDFVPFLADTEEDIVKEFKAAVDDYLEFRETYNKLLT